MATADTESGSVRLQADRASRPDQGLQPWQFFVLAALACATAATFIARGRGVTVIVLLTILMGATALVGLAALRALRPLVSPEDDRTSMIGERTRVSLEREKLLTLRTIKEMEFDRAMKKLSEEDFREMSGRLRTRAARLMRQLDAGTGYRDQIERDLAKRLGERSAADAQGPASTKQDALRKVDSTVAPETARLCANCSTPNEADARFCKACGERL